MAAADVVFFGSCPNEQVAIAHLRRHLHELTAGDIALSRANCFHPHSLRALPAFICHAFRLHRVARRLVRRFHFLPACRIFSTMTYYLRFRRLLAAGQSKSVFIANHYSPECLALAAAAHQSGRRVFCTNHANGTWRSGYVPPLHSDLVAVTSAAILEAYAKHSGRTINSILIPQPSPQRPMQARIDPGKPITVGIFLTALTNMQHLETLVRRLEASPMIARVLIRAHPVKVVNEDLSPVVALSGRVEESAGIPLFENIGLCDVAICGNSSVTIDVLRGGVPVFYDNGLDDLAFDVNGYLDQKLVLQLPAALDAAALQALERFYGDPAWQKVMHYFDASYRQDEGAMFRRLQDSVGAMIRASEAPEVRALPQSLPVDVSRPITVS